MRTNRNRRFGRSAASGGDSVLSFGWQDNRTALSRQSGQKTVRGDFLVGIGVDRLAGGRYKARSLPRLAPSTKSWLPPRSGLSHEPTLRIADQQYSPDARRRDRGC